MCSIALQTLPDQVQTLTHARRPAKASHVVCHVHRWIWLFYCIWHASLKARWDEEGAEGLESRISEGKLDFQARGEEEDNWRDGNAPNLRIIRKNKTLFDFTDTLSNRFWARCLIRALAAPGRGRILKTWPALGLDWLIKHTRSQIFLILGHPVTVTRASFPVGTASGLQSLGRNLEDFKASMNEEGKGKKIFSPSTL